MESIFGRIYISNKNINKPQKSTIFYNHQETKPEINQIVKNIN